MLVALGAAVGVAPGSWTAVPSGAVTGLGIGGYAIVVPKLAHELSVRGHRRLVPRVRALAPAGAGLTLVASACGGAIAPGQSRACAWAVPASLALAGSALAMGLPETPHWYAARGRLDAAYEALKRMHGVLEAAVAIDWVRLDAGMQGEQRPLAVDDLRIAQVRRTVLAGLVLEAVQALPLGLTAICLAPWALGDVGGPVPVRPLIVLGLSWTALAVVGARRRSERLPLAWVLGGTGASACAVVLLLLLDGLDGGGALVLLGKEPPKKNQGAPVLAPAGAALEASPDAEGEDWARTLLHEAALAASGSTLTARSGEQCRTCPVKDSCPIQPEGRRAVA